MTLTAQQFVRIYNDLPNPSLTLHRIREGEISPIYTVNYLKDGDRIVSIQIDNSIPRNLADVDRISFELMEDKNEPYWQPTQPVSICSYIKRN